MDTKSKIVIILFILIVAFLLRFYKITEVPAELGTDGVVQAYNAFSILHTGKDRYGEQFPILFRLHNLSGSYQPPLYTYLTAIPIAIFGNTVFSAYFVSIISGTLLALISFILVMLLFDIKGTFILASIAAFTLAIIPWSIFYSRLIVEANLGVAVFAFSLILFLSSLKRLYLFPLACLTLGLSTYAYYSEQVIAVLFLPIFLLLFRKKLLTKYFSFSGKNKWIYLGLALFAVSLLLHIKTLETGAFTRRFNQVSYVSNQFVGNSYLALGQSFISQYLSYYNPRNLFFATESKLGRFAPELGVFYSWMIIPFLIGLVYLIKNYKTTSAKFLALLFIITPIPAGVTADLFYPLRTLSFLWVVTVIIGIGIYQVYLCLKPILLKLLIFVFLILYSLFSLYISYFILFKHEFRHHFGYPTQKLLSELNSYQNKQIMLDSTRDSGLGIRIAFLTNYDPKDMQNQLKSQLATPYYTSAPNYNETYKMGNIEVRPIDWSYNCKKDMLFVGDTLAISEKQIQEYNLKLEFEIKDILENILLSAYSNNRQGC